MNQKKSKIVAALLAWFFGAFGAHRYYLGYKKRGILMTIGGISTIIGLIIEVAVGVSVSSGYSSRYYSGPGVGERILVIIACALFIFGGVIVIMAFIDLIKILCNKLLPADGSDWSNGVNDAIGNTVSRVSRSATVVPQSAQPVSQHIVDSLAAVDAFYRYNDLIKQEIITKEEFDAKKQQLLGL